MKKQDRDPILFIEDIEISISKIFDYTNNMKRAVFLKNDLVKDGVIRNFEIIGEATRNIPTSLKEKYPDTPWETMYRLRNIVSHEYFSVDYESVWNIIKEYLPDNKKQIEHILQIERKS
jgi:uncharacterized protein with HEPN domain